MFSKNNLNITVDDLRMNARVYEAKTLQIASTISPTNKYYVNTQLSEVVLKGLKDITSFTYNVQNENNEDLICLFLNEQNYLLKNKIVDIVLIDKLLFYQSKLFYLKPEFNVSNMLLVNVQSSKDLPLRNKYIKTDMEVVQKKETIKIPVIDFVVDSNKEDRVLYNEKRTKNKYLDYISEGVQGTLFDLLEIEKPTCEIGAEKVQETYFHVPQVKINHFQLQNRRYIGNKFKLIKWIFSILIKECEGKTFTDIFAGTGVVAAVASKHFEKIILNDFLYSNQAIYKAFFDNGNWNADKINKIIKEYNNINGEDLDENYFSLNFGGKYFSKNSAKIIGYLRESIEKNKDCLTEREYNMLISSLLYSIDKIANTVGHYDAYFNKDFIEDNFYMRPIDPIDVKKVSIYREDANLLAKQINTDIVYIDPPYNSRQYSRFYHILETLTKWDKPKLHGVALKPDPENMSDYCRISARNRFEDLVSKINAKYLVVSYNNTYEPKSSSSLNKITLEEINNILSTCGKTKVFVKDYRHFNAGNTNFNNHKEYLFVTKTKL